MDGPPLTKSSAKRPLEVNRGASSGATPRIDRRRLPRIRPDDPEPPGADDVLCAVAHYYRPHDPVGITQIRRAIAVSGRQAEAVMAWAQRNGAWPYRQPDAGTRSRAQTAPISLRARLAAWRAGGGA